MGLHIHVSQHDGHDKEHLPGGDVGSTSEDIVVACCRVDWIEVEESTNPK